MFEAFTRQADKCGLWFVLGKVDKLYLILASVLKHLLYSFVHCAV